MPRDPNSQLSLLVNLLLDACQNLFQEKLVLSSFLQKCLPDQDWKQLLNSEIAAGTGEQEAGLALMRLRQLALAALSGEAVPAELLKPPLIQ